MSGTNLNISITLNVNELNLSEGRDCQTGLKNIQYMLKMRQFAFYLFSMFKYADIQYYFTLVSGIQHTD